MASEHACEWCPAPATGRALRDDGQAWDYCERHGKKASHEAGAIVNGKTTVSFRLVAPGETGDTSADGVPPACEWGPPAHCEGPPGPKHAKCAHAPGGPQQFGSLSSDGHLWCCPCPCHAGQVRPRCPHPVHVYVDPPALVDAFATVGWRDPLGRLASEGGRHELARLATDPAEFLQWSAGVQLQVEVMQRAAVAALRDVPVSWRIIGDYLGVQKQSAQERFSPKGVRPTQVGPTLLDVLAEQEGVAYPADAASGSRS